MRSMRSIITCVWQSKRPGSTARSSSCPPPPPSSPGPTSTIRPSSTTTSADASVAVPSNTRPPLKTVRVIVTSVAPIFAYRGGSVSCARVCASFHTLSEAGPMAMARTNLTLPVELIREVDEVAGPRGRSAYVAEAVRYRLKRDKLRRGLDGTFGVTGGTSEWRSPDEVYRWGRSLREGPQRDDGLWGRE